MHPTLEQHVEHLQKNRHVGGTPPDINTSAEIVVKTDTLRIAWFVNLTFWFFSFLLLPSAFSPLDEEKMMWLFYVIYFIFGYIQLLSLYNPDNPLDLVT